MNSGDVILQTVKLKKYFGEIHAVDDVDLKVGRRELLSIIGPNGAGKTTLINVLTGNLPADSGEIYFEGKKITRMPVHSRIKLGINRSFQIVNIFPGLTVFQNVQVPVISFKKKSLKMFDNLKKLRDVSDEVERILKTVGLEDKKNTLAGTLSHGDQKLLEIAMALATKPKLLFLDEPTAGMNPVERERTLEFIRKLHSETDITIIIVEHDMDVVFAVSQRILVMNRGQIIVDGKPSEIRESKLVREVYLGEEF